MRHRATPTVLIGPNALAREGLARILTSSNFRILASGHHLRDLASISHNELSLLVIDSSRRPNSVIAQIELFKKQNSSGRVAVLTDQCRLGEMISAFRAGANLYFENFASSETFIKTLELIILGETILPPQLLALIGEPGTDSEGLPGAVDEESFGGRTGLKKTESTLQLSAREKGILRLIVDGESNKTIARRIDIAEATVKVHVKGILRKIRVRNRTQAAIWAMNNSCALRPAAADQNLVTVQTPPPVTAHVQNRLLPALSPTNGNHRADGAVVNVHNVIRAAIEARTDKDGKTVARVVGSRPHNCER